MIPALFTHVPVTTVKEASDALAALLAQKLVRDALAAGGWQGQRAVPQRARRDHAYPGVGVADLDSIVMTRKWPLVLATHALGVEFEFSGETFHIQKTGGYSIRLVMDGSP